MKLVGFGSLLYAFTPFHNGKLEHDLSVTIIYSPLTCSLNYSKAHRRLKRDWEQFVQGQSNFFNANMVISHSKQSVVCKKLRSTPMQAYKFSYCSDRQHMLCDMGEQAGIFEFIESDKLADQNNNSMQQFQISSFRIQTNDPVCTSCNTHPIYQNCQKLLKILV